MKCRYYFNGTTFNSELALDEYLLKVLLLTPELKDAVFLKRLPQAVAEIARQLNNLNRATDIKRSYTLVEDGQIVEEISAGQAISAIKFISIIPNTATGGKLVTPEFNAENYWENHVKDWNAGQYSKIEEKILGILNNEDDGLIPSTKVGDSYMPTISNFKTSTSLFKTMRKHVEKVWEWEAHAGTAIHDVMSLVYYFEGGYPLKDVLSSKESIKLKIQRLRDKKEGETIADNISEYLTDENIDSIAEYAVEFNKNLCYKMGVSDVSELFVYSEGGIVADYDINSGEGRKVGQIAGRMDLFVMNINTGESAIIDFKCSPQETADVNTNVKELTYSYQLAIYRRMLELLGVLKPRTTLSKSDVDHCNLWVTPILMSGFSYDRNTEKSTFKEVQFQEMQTTIASPDSTKDEQRIKILTNINNVIPINLIISADQDANLSEIDEIQKRRFPVLEDLSYNTLDKVLEYIDSHGKIVYDKVTKTWAYRPTKGSSDIKSEKTDEAAAKVDILLQLLQKLNHHRLSVVTTVKTIKSKIDSDTARFTTSIKGVAPDWLENKFEKYRDSNYEILTFDDSTEQWLESKGYILFQHKLTKNIDVFKVSSYPDLRKKIVLNKTSDLDNPLLLGTYMSDEVQKSIPNELTLPSIVGNIELMEVMEVLNHLPGTFGGKAIGHIEVINPYTERVAITASNKELAYNYKQLCAHDKFFNPSVRNNFEGNNKIKLCSAVDLARTAILDAISISSTYKSRQYTDYKKAFEEATTWNPDLDVAANRERIILELNKIKKQLEAENPSLAKLNKDTTITFSHTNNADWYIHHFIQEAILELSNIPMRLQIQGSDNYVLGGLSFKRLLQKGWNGLLIDNPGTLLNQNLNEMTKALNVAYQRERELVLAFTYELRDKLRKLQDSKSFLGVVRYTGGNQAALFENMFLADENGLDKRLILRNPFDPQTINSLSPEELDFLKFTLTITTSHRKGRDIFKNRISEGELEKLIEKDPDLLYLPLLAGGIGSSQVVYDSLFEGMKLKVKRVFKFAKDFADDLNGTYQEEIEEKVNTDGTLWEAANRYEIGDDVNKRAEYMDLKGGAGYFDTNLEHILLGTTVAKVLLNELNKVFPIIQAVSSNLLAQSITLNIDMANDIDYICKFVKSKIFNRIIDAKAAGDVGDAIRDIRGKASKLGLAFNIKQLYQVEDGIFKIAGLMTRKPDGTSAFTLENVRKAGSFVIKDLAHFGTSISMCEAFNYTYGINDMDTNQLAQKMSQDNVGIYNLSDLSMRMASRPDYYNRSLMFVSRMMADGCFEAHTMENGQLKYDWTKDKRFEVFARGEVTHPDYKKQKGFYYEVCRQFIREGAMDPKDLNLENPKPLPRAYTVQEAESIKALADRMYGYYSHEKKSLIQSFSLGALFFQMNTFWSAIKNQWISGRRYTLEGHYVPYTEPKPGGQPGETIQYYWKAVTDPNTGITDMVMQSEEETDLPVMVWKGLPLEGIIVTFARFARIFLGKDPTFSDGKGLTGVVNYYRLLSRDPDVQLLYRSNLRQLWYDLGIFFLIGQFIGAWLLARILDEARKERGNETLKDAAINNLATWQLTMLIQAGNSYNGLGNIVGKGVDWTPYALTLSMNILGQVLSFIGGEKDAYDLFMSIGAAPKQFKYLGDYVKFETIGRHIGDSGDEDEE